jgi:general secretion pathway protein A
MYKPYFKLTRNPFDLTPDPVCFVPTKRHSEALAALYYCVRQHKGFVVVTGEVGTGKTLLLRCLLGQLKESKDIALAYLFNARLSPTEFLQYILTDFGLPTSGKNKCDLLVDLSHFLVSRSKNKMTTVLILDEAHHLSEEILEEVRLLSNLETTDDKLLQIIMAGQPELDQKLDSFELRQLKQRISVRAQLEPLDSEETKRYIERRLQVAGAECVPSSLFPEPTIASVYHHSQGLPRLINTICENALILAYANEVPTITPDIIRVVAKELRLDVISEPAVKRNAKPTANEVLEFFGVMIDLYSALRKPTTGDPRAGTSVAIQGRPREPHS